MSTISIPISDEDLLFLRSFTNQHGLSLEDFMAQHAANLKRNLESTLHHDVIAASGVFKSGSDPLLEYYEYQDRKHS